MRSSWNTWPPSRLCEYDENEIEYWVNTRTSGVLSREDMQRLSISRSHEGEGELGSEGMEMPPDDGMEAGGFGDFGAAGDVSQEGDSALQVSKLHTSEHMVLLCSRPSRAACFQRVSSQLHSSHISPRPNPS